MSADPHFEVLATVPWGEGPDALPPTLLDHPPFSEFVPEQLRQVRRPLRLRSDLQGGMQVLVEPPAPAAIVHLGADGRPRGRTPLGSADGAFGQGARVLDFAVDRAGASYVLEAAAPGGGAAAARRLRQIAPTGVTRWSRELPIVATGDAAETPVIVPSRLYIDAVGRLYLPDGQGTGLIAELDPATGALMQVQRTGQPGGAVFINTVPQAVSVLYFPESNRRGLGYYNLADQGSAFWVGGKDLYGWLLSPIGLDGQSRLYVWKDSSLARIDPEGGLEVLASLDNLVPGPAAGVLYSSRFAAGEDTAPRVQVSIWGAAGLSDERILWLPPERAAPANRDWRLIQVDDQGRYVVFGGEAPGQLGTLLVYAQDGELVGTRSPPPDLLSLESRLADHRYWGLDAAGRVYFPVLTPLGFWVVRLTAVSGSEHSRTRG